MSERAEQHSHFIFVTSKRTLNTSRLTINLHECGWSWGKRGSSWTLRGFKYFYSLFFPPCNFMFSFLGCCCCCYDKCCCHPSFPHRDNKDWVTGRWCEYAGSQINTNTRAHTNTHAYTHTHTCIYTHTEGKQIHTMLIICSKYFVKAGLNSHNWMIQTVINRIEQTFRLLWKA